MSDVNGLRSFTISQLFPSNVGTTEEGLAAVNSPFSVLVALLSDDAQVMPKGVVIRKGEVALIPPGVPCWISPENELQVELAAVDFSFKANGLDISPALPDTPIVIPGKYGEQLAADACAICNTAGGGVNLSRTTAILKAGYSIAHTLSKVLGWDSIPEVFHHEDSELLTLTSYLKANYHLPLTVEDIAAACNVSRRKLFKVAARHKSGTPMRLLKQIRLEQSLAYLRADELSIGQIASKVGFLDARNFSREFKKQYGQTPQQYRQQSSLNVHTETLASKADSNLRLNLAKRAVVLYQQAIDSAPQSTDLNRLHYQAGLAFKRVGDSRGASEAWRKVTTLYYRLLIGLEECADLNKTTDYERVAETLRRAYEYGDKGIRDRAIDLLGNYMLQSALDGKQVAGKYYCKLACDLAPGHQVLQPKLARALYVTGQFREIEQWCPEQDHFYAGALRAMGKFTEHLEIFPDLRQQNALIHLRMNNPDIVLSDYDEFPEICVFALIESGQLEEAVKRYPEHNVRALLALGRNEEILKDYAENQQMFVFALANLGRVEEALERAADHTELMARLLLHIERPHEITLAPSLQHDIPIIRAAKVLQGIHSLEKGDHRFALDIFESVLPVTDADHRIDHEFYQSDIIIPLIRFLLNDLAAEMPHSRWPSWPNHFSRIVQNHRYCYAQCLWYEVRFILGDASENDYNKQPFQRYLQTRLNLVKGVKAELHNDRQTARACYQRYMETLPPLSKVFCTSGRDPVLKAFVRWRISELERG